MVFDPHAALALTVARDQVQNPAPVIAVVAELDPATAWAQTDADRFLAIDELAAVALADAGVEGERILVVGAIGERAFADAAREDRAALAAEIDRYTRDRTLLETLRKALGLPPSRGAAIERELTQRAAGARGGPGAG